MLEGKNNKNINFFYILLRCFGGSVNCKIQNKCRKIYKMTQFYSNDHARK